MFVPLFGIIFYVSTRTDFHFSADPNSVKSANIPPLRAVFGMYDVMSCFILLADIGIIVILYLEMLIIIGDLV